MGKLSPKQISELPDCYKCPTFANWIDGRLVDLGKDEKMVVGRTDWDPLNSNRTKWGELGYLLEKQLEGVLTQQVSREPARPKRVGRNIIMEKKMESQEAFLYGVARRVGIKIGNDNDDSNNKNFHSFFDPQEIHPDDLVRAVEETMEQDLVGQGGRVISLAMAVIKQAGWIEIEAGNEKDKISNRKQPGDIINAQYRVIS